jgi:phosphoribosylaminoimidazolecarboxamide formyltransferase/IMP cyclohydrolase
MRKIKNALISVFHKDGLDEIILKLNTLGVELYSTGGTYDYIKSLGINAHQVEDLTSYPSILGGRVKTLHPKVFGGILARRELQSDLDQLAHYEIPEFDLVIVDLYPFEKTVASGASEQDIIEKIDIGGISLIRAGAKNFKDVIIVASQNNYSDLKKLLDEKSGISSLEDRRFFATQAFAVSSYYDSKIYNWFSLSNEEKQLRIVEEKVKTLRYGENPHQKGYFYGDLDQVVEILAGKELSYNNLLDVDAAIRLIADFDEPTFAILKHNNACGIASAPKLIDAWKAALAGDPVSAFGGVLITNRPIDLETAQEIDKLFYEVVISFDFEVTALEFLRRKGTRIILKLKMQEFDRYSVRTTLNGFLVQNTDFQTETKADMKVVTTISPNDSEFEDLVFANKVVKHTKSNAMVIVKNKQLIASGVGETSRVDAFKQAIEKAHNFGKDIKGAVLASDAFFPFADNVELAHGVGINAIVQPGGSKKDQDSVDYCNEHGMAMCFTGSRHFKH